MHAVERKVLIVLVAFALFSGSGCSGGENNHKIHQNPDVVEGNLVVETRAGFVRGTSMKTKKGRDLDAFMSIPYAQPPLGGLRFKPPVPASTWKGIREPSKQQQHVVCPQRNIYTRSEIIEGDEDCLYLNVYRPRRMHADHLLPVMFFLHGGGWLACSGNHDSYGPEVLLDEDVLLVIPNYRLGALGFLSTEDLVVPGNNGLKDQVLAMQWTKDNVELFGGDPNSITIFGESAGGASVHLHMMSPLTKGLFHRAISQSGTALCLWSCGYEGYGRKQAQKLGTLLGCAEVEDSATLVECLRGKDALDIVALDKEFMLWDTDPMIPFRPMKELMHDGAFLTDFPANLIRQGKVHNVPWMNGVNKDEGLLRATALYGMPELLNEFNTNLDFKLAVSLQYHELAEDPSSISRQIRKFYLNNQAANNETRQGVIDIFTDGMFHHGTDLATFLHLKHFPDRKVFYYLFAHRGVASFSQIFGDENNNYGVCHADELQYLFPVGDALFPNSPKDDKDQRVTDLMTTLWTNFARFGDPTPDNGHIAPQWAPVRDARSLNYFYIEGDAPHELRNEDGLFLERAMFWRELPIRPEMYTQRVSTWQRTKEEL